MSGLARLLVCRLHEPRSLCRTLHALQAKLKAGDEQSFLLPPTFTTNETGFKSIAINENVTVSIFSLGNAVIDAHGENLWRPPHCTWEEGGDTHTSNYV